MKRLLLTVGIASIALLIAGCDVQPADTSNKGIQAQKASAVANSIQFSENSEIDNIKRRLELTSKPGQIGFIILLNEAGQPILYTSVKGKVTSGSKRLTSPDLVVSADCGESYCDQIRQGPSDEGTFGSSGEYIYFWTTSGAYKQWNGKYLYSDSPLRLSVQPLVIENKAVAEALAATR